MSVGTQWWGVWCWRDNGPSFWRGAQGRGPGEEGPELLETTETEARKTADRLNEFARERTDSLGWRYEARPFGHELARLREIANAARGYLNSATAQVARYRRVALEKAVERWELAYPERPREP
jgi:hypothetical protein